MIRSFAALGLLMLSACTSDPAVARTEAASKDVATFRKQLGECRAQVETTLKSLNALSTAQGDLKGPFDGFLKECERLQAEADRARAQADEVRAGNNRIFYFWEEEIARIKDASLRAAAESRKEARAKDYAKIDETLQAAKPTFGAFKDTLSDLKKALAPDLTPKGISAASGAFTKANLQGGEVRKQLDLILEAVDRVAKDLDLKR